MTNPHTEECLMFSTIEWVISVTFIVCHHTQNGNCAVWNVLGKGCLKKISCMRNTWKSWWTLISWSCPVSFSFPCLRLTLWDRFLEVCAWLYRCAFVKHYGMCMIPTLTPDIRSPTRSFFWMSIVAAMTGEVRQRWSRSLSSNPNTYYTIYTQPFGPEF